MRSRTISDGLCLSVGSKSIYEAVVFLFGDEVTRFAAIPRSADKKTESHRSLPLRQILLLNSFHPTEDCYPSLHLPDCESEKYW